MIFNTGVSLRLELELFTVLPIHTILDFIPGLVDQKVRLYS